MSCHCTGACFRGGGCRAQPGCTETFNPTAEYELLVLRESLMKRTEELRAQRVKLERLFAIRSKR